MRNIELKAKLVSRSSAEAACGTIGAEFQGDIHQVDTYFAVASGRLKLREAEPGPTELVAYQRPDIAGPKGCEYQLETVGPGIKPLLANTLGEIAVVDKVRSLYLWKNVRIHLDEVQDLGAFIEFEAVQEAGAPDSDGIEKLNFLTQALKITEDACQEYSYLELMAGA